MVIWSNPAKDDLRRIHDYIAQDSKFYAIKVTQEFIEKYKNLVCGWKVSGAGGGGYLILISEKPIDRGIKIKIRRPGN